MITYHWGIRELFVHQPMDLFMVDIFDHSLSSSENYYVVTLLLSGVFFTILSFSTSFLVLQFSFLQFSSVDTFDTLEYKGLLNKILDTKWVGLKINELLVVEYYSRQS